MEIKVSHDSSLYINTGREKVKATPPEPEFALPFLSTPEILHAKPPLP
jgi:hypothetical protein